MDGEFPCNLYGNIILAEWWFVQNNENRGCRISWWGQKITEFHIGNPIIKSKPDVKLANLMFVPNFVVFGFSAKTKIIFANVGCWIPYVHLIEKVIWLVKSLK